METHKWEEDEWLDFVCTSCGARKEYSRQGRPPEKEYCFGKDVTSKMRNGERLFQDRLFMGAGEHTAARCQLLHQILDEAFVELSGMQQNGGQGSTFDEAQHEEATRRLLGAASDLWVALTGEEPKGT